MLPPGGGSITCRIQMLRCLNPTLLLSCRRLLQSIYTVLPEEEACLKFYVPTNKVDEIIRRLLKNKFLELKKKKIIFVLQYVLNILRQHGCHPEALESTELQNLTQFKHAALKIYYVDLNQCFHTCAGHVFAGKS